MLLFISRHNILPFFESLIAIHYIQKMPFLGLPFLVSGVFIMYLNFVISHFHFCRHSSVDCWLSAKMEGWKSIRISVSIDGGIPVVSGDMGTFMPFLANIVEGGQYKIGETIFGGLGRAFVGDVEVLREENSEEVIFFAVVFVIVFHFVVCLIFYFYLLDWCAAFQVLVTEGWRAWWAVVLGELGSQRRKSCLELNSWGCNNIYEKELLLCCCLWVVVLFQCLLKQRVIERLKLLPWFLGGRGRVWKVFKIFFNIHYFNYNAYFS